MSTQKIAITVPPPFLKRVDKWAEKMGKSRSRFIVDELNSRLTLLEDEEVTRMYNEVCDDPNVSGYDQELAEEMLSIGAVRVEGDEW
ncbi:MAG: hypothetical protein U5R49_17925 [Deltaproteobacteria bacterium]|nr:hypothetical protein [Deltaproteobacteria bacterium]